MGFVSHRGIALILIGWSEIQQVCFLDVNLCVPFQSMTQNLLYLSNVSVTKFLRRNNVVEFSCTIKIKMLTEEATS